MLVSRITFTDRPISLFTHCTQFDLGMVYDEAGKRFLKEPSQLGTVVDSLACHTPSSSWCSLKELFQFVFHLIPVQLLLIHD